MRRTDQEFRAEVLRRAQEYRTRINQQRKILMGTVVCVILVIFGGAVTLPVLGGMGAASGENAPLMDAAPAEAPGAENIQNSMDYAWDLIPMVMIDGRLYLDTGYYNGNREDEGHFDGEITSKVDQSMEPQENDQSNFGLGYGYQYGAKEGTVEIFINGKWCIFATEEAISQFYE